MDWDYLTTLSLVAVFLAAELYRCFGSRRGVILDLKSDERVAALNSATALIRLEDGNEIAAEIPPCTLCLGRLGIGEEVRVIRGARGYSVDLPWFLRSRRSRLACGCDRVGQGRGLRS
ncbi:MAG: hypothetical protein ACP5M0_11550 [Desulfomonilaceae bacterium]